MARLRPPSGYVIFNVTFKMRDHVRTIGLIAVSGQSPPLCTLRRPTHTQYSTIPIQNALERSRPVLSHLPVPVFVFGYIAARLCCLQSLPVQHDHCAYTVTIS